MVITVTNLSHEKSVMQVTCYMTLSQSQWKDDDVI